FARGLARVPGKPVELLLVIDDLHEGIGRVEYVLRELLRERGLSLLYLGETLTRRRYEFRTAEAEIAKRVIDDAPPSRRKRFILRRCRVTLVLREKRLVLR